MKSDDMSPKDYIEIRLNDQIDWYSNKSKKYKRIYLSLKSVELLLASSLPFLISYVRDSDPHMKTITGIMGVFIAVISGYLTLNKFSKLWIEYRTNSEQLKHHKYLFLTCSAPYGKSDSFQVFVSNIEALISKENSRWIDLLNKDKKEASAN